MPRQLKVCACITFIVAVLFYLFFQFSKHNAALSLVNAFADDPYDSVGSFGVQLALFTALLSLLRAFRPYPAKQASFVSEHQNQKLLLLRSGYISCLAVASTVVADTIAMVRHPTLWIGTPAGYLLATFVGGMALLTVMVGWLLYRSSRTIRVPTSQKAWIRAILLSILGVIVLAFYPENIRQQIGGELFTVVVGIVFLVVPIWAMSVALLPPVPETYVEDLIDDFAAVYQWLRAHSGFLVVVFIVLEKMSNTSFVRLVVNWLNPRKHPWNVCILLGILIGGILVLAETLGGGGPQHLGQLLLIVSIFIGLECVGVVLSYALLARPLGLFRRDAGETLVHRISSSGK